MGAWARTSSPSKSALYGVHTHSFRRNVRYGRTLTWRRPVPCITAKRSGQVSRFGHDVGNPNIGVART